MIEGSPTVEDYRRWRRLARELADTQAERNHLAAKIEEVTDERDRMILRVEELEAELAHLESGVETIIDRLDAS